MATKATLVQTDNRKGAYGMLRNFAVVDHPRHGRLLLSQGFGGGDVGGQCYRWKCGNVQQVPSDYLIPDEDDNDAEDATDHIAPLEWPGYMIEKVAESVGL